MLACKRMPNMYINERLSDHPGGLPVTETSRNRFESFTLAHTASIGYRVFGLAVSVCCAVKYRGNLIQSSWVPQITAEDLVLKSEMFISYQYRDWKTKKTPKVKTKNLIIKARNGHGHYKANLRDDGFLGNVSYYPASVTVAHRTRHSAIFLSWTMLLFTNSKTLRCN